MPPFIFLFLVLCVLGTGNSVLLAQTTGFDKCKEFLMDRGIDTRKCHFESIYENDSLTIFSDKRNRTTLIVANDKFSEVLNGNTLLYWSNEFAHTSTSLNVSITKYIEYWKWKIKELTGQGSNDGVGRETPYLSQKQSVSPLLGNIKFGQGFPYNVMCPMRNGKKALVGCVPVACSQVMAMYRYPEHGVGQHKYLLDNNKTQVYKDFTDVYPNWDYTLQHNLSKNNDSLSIYYISTLLTAVSASLGADFGSNRTSAHFNNVKTAMVNFWQYSPEMRFITNVGEDMMLGLMYRELDNNRPVLISDIGHCYLCDGYDGSFMHMNLGWNGIWNGYYRMINVQDKENSLPIKSIVTNIKPNKNERKELSLELKSADMLRMLLSDEDQRNVNKLTLSGVLGNDDIKLLRQMLGASNTGVFDWTGVLTELDISNTKFKTDSKGCFMSEELHGDAGSTTKTRRDGFGNIVEKTVFKFNYDTMSDSDWRIYQESGMNEKPGYEVVRDKGKYIGRHFVKTGTIGVSMFEDCTNLQSIKLPLKVNEISSRAFANCSSLKNVGTHKDITIIGQYAFARCTLLQEVHVHKSSVSEFHLKAFQNSNPWIMFVYDL